MGRVRSVQCQTWGARHPKCLLIRKICCGVWSQQKWYERLQQVLEQILLGSVGCFCKPRDQQPWRHFETLYCSDSQNCNMLICTSNTVTGMVLKSGYCPKWFIYCMYSLKMQSFYCCILNLTAVFYSWMQSLCIAYYVLVGYVLKRMVLLLVWIILFCSGLCTFIST